MFVNEFSEIFGFFMNFLIFRIFLVFSIFNDFLDFSWFWGFLRFWHFLRFFFGKKWVLRKTCLKSEKTRFLQRNEKFNRPYLRSKSPAGPGKDTNGKVEVSFTLQAQKQKSEKLGPDLGNFGQIWLNSSILRKFGWQYICSSVEMGDSSYTYPYYSKVNLPHGTIGFG